MKLSPESIVEIRALGLYVDAEPCFVSDHVAFPNGYVVIKPEKTLGNFVPGREGWFTNYLGVDEITDAPPVYIFFKEGQWWYEVCEYMPGPGPGDFRRSAESEPEVLEKLRVYFFESNPDFEALKDAGT